MGIFQTAIVRIFSNGITVSLTLFYLCIDFLLPQVSMGFFQTAIVRIFSNGITVTVTLFYLCVDFMITQSLPSETFVACKETIVLKHVGTYNLAIIKILMPLHRINRNYLGRKFHIP